MIPTGNEATCRTCNTTKPLIEFYPLPYGGKGVRGTCKACTKAKRHREYVEKSIPSRNRDAVYEQLLKRDYGLSLGEYNVRLARQAHRCAICRRPESIPVKGGGRRRLSVDHDHVTGRLRGLLCHRCNILVWAFEENHTTLSAIAAYIEDFRASLAGGDP